MAKARIKMERCLIKMMSAITALIGATVSEQPQGICFLISCGVVTYNAADRLANKLDDFMFGVVGDAGYYE